MGILTIIGIFGFTFSMFVTFTGYGIEITDAVYVKQSDLVIHYSQNNPNEIESYEVKIVNTTNKEFVDYEVRLTLYIINGSIDHYPHVSTPTQVITIKPKEEKVIVFDNVGGLTSIDLEGFYGESLELEYLSEKATSINSAYYNQFDNGKDFNAGIQTAYIIGCVLVGVKLAVCLIIETILLIKLFKPSKKLIKSMVKEK